MPSLWLHPATKKIIDSYTKSPAHALILTGSIGAGLGTLALDLGTSLSGNRQSVSVIAPEKGLISIDRVRQLYEQTRSIQRTKRCIVIDDADAMSHDAQNALLKLLEEPVENVHFILTTHQSQQLLATIRSRAQIIAVRPLDEAMSKTVLESYDLSPTSQAQALFLASGQPAELIRLASDVDYFASQTTIVTDARSFLQTDQYARLIVMKKYMDRSAALTFLAMCSKLLTFSVLRQRNYSVTDAMEAVEIVMKRIEANGHVRTHLLYLVTKLP